MFKKIVSKLPISSFKNIESSPFFRRTTKKPVLCCKKELKNLKINIEDHGIRFSRKVSPMLKDVFMHMVRNSMDHGIETKDQRLAKGKDMKGKINISSSCVDSTVLIDVWDDGCGLNLNLLWLYWLWM